jgi:hypothetical protein
VTDLGEGQGAMMVSRTVALPGGPRRLLRLLKSTEAFREVGAAQGLRVDTTATKSVGEGVDLVDAGVAQLGTQVVVRADEVKTGDNAAGEVCLGQSA